MTDADLVERIFDREGRTYAEPPAIDQPTGPGGITLATLTAYRGHACTVDDLRALTLAEAHQVVAWVLQRLATTEGLDRIGYAPLRLQMIDFAYNSGAPRAFRWLQRVLRVAPTGRMDEPTELAVNSPALDPFLLHQALIAARLQMIDRATDPGGSVDKKFEEGLENRALQFSLLQI